MEKENCTFTYCESNRELIINGKISDTKIKSILEHPDHFNCRKLSIEFILDYGGTYSFYNRNILIPKYVMFFSMPKYFNSHIVISPFVKYLEFGNEFNTHILLPKYLEYLSYNEMFTEKSKLPKHMTVVKNIRFGKRDMLSKNIKHITFLFTNDKQILLPKKLLVLHILRSCAYKLCKIIFPKCLTELVLGPQVKYSDYRLYLPESLTKLSFRGEIIFDAYVHRLKEISTVIKFLSLNNCEYLVAELPNSMTTFNFDIGTGTCDSDPESPSYAYIINLRARKIKIMQKTLNQRYHFTHTKPFEYIFTKINE